MAEPRIPSRLLPPTEKQLDHIDGLCRRLNTWTPEPANRAQASQMIEGLQRRLADAAKSDKRG